MTKTKDKQKIEKIPREKGYVKAIDTEVYETSYQSVEFWTVEGLTADSIEGKISLLRKKLNEIIDRLNEKR